MAALTVSRLVKALRSVPEKTFRVMDLAPTLIDEKGQVVLEKAMDAQGELNLAITEVETYIKGTNAARNALRIVGGRPMDDFDNDDPEDPGE